MTANKITTGYAIARGKRLYCGWNHTKKQAIWEHCYDLGKTWEECKKDGDYVTIVIIRWEQKEKLPPPPSKD